MSIVRRMKKLFCCGLYQEKSASPSNDATLSTESKTNSTIRIAADHGEQSGWYTAFCDKTEYTLPVRYQDLVPIGQGAYGSVIRATDTETAKYVTIKKLLRPFQTPTHAKRTYRELKLLIYLNHPDAQVVQLYNVFTPEKNLNDFETLYFVFNYVDYDLNKVIQRHIPFGEEHIKQIIYSLFRGLKFIHSAGIIHRDLKPTNIGIDQNSNVTILDFGLACHASDVYLPDYIVVRWWHAPEVFINSEGCDGRLDTWSVGCIMAELILLRPLFRGRDPFDQLNEIFDIIGTPDVATLDDISTPEVRAYLGQLTPKPKRNFNQLFGFQYDPGTQTPVSGVSPEGVDLLDRLLTFDPRLRPTANEALAHPFFESFRDPMEEPTRETMVDEHEHGDYSITQWKSIIWQMIEEFRPPSWVQDDLVDD